MGSSHNGSPPRIGWHNPLTFREDLAIRPILLLRAFDFGSPSEVFDHFVYQNQ